MVPRDQWQAIELELLRMGYRLGDIPKRVNWRVVHAIASRLWTIEQELAAQTTELLSLLVWFKTKDGQAGRKRPQPIPRPWDEYRNKAEAKQAGLADYSGATGDQNGRIIGDEAITIERMNSIFDRWKLTRKGATGG